MLRLSFAAFAVLAASSGCRERQPTPTAPPQTPMRIAFFLGGRTANMYRAWENKVYSSFGLNVELITKNLYDSTGAPSNDFKTVSENYNQTNAGYKFGKATGDELIDYMLAGKADGATVGEVSFIHAISEGKPIVAVSELGFDSPVSPGHAIVLRKGALEEFRKTGKKLHLVSRRSSGGDIIFVKEFFAKRGLDPDQVFDLDSNLPEDKLAKALRHGKADGAYVHLLSTLAEAGKHHLLERFEVYPLDWLNPELSQAVLVFPKDYVTHHPDEITRLIRANIKQTLVDQEQAPKQKLMEPGEKPKHARGRLIVPDFQGMELPVFRTTPTVRLDLLNEMQRLMLKYHMEEKSAQLEGAIDNQFALKASRPEFQNLIVIGWDGTQRDRMEELLNAGKLPHLKQLIADGSFVKTEVVQGRTETKPGWAQIFTGYNTDFLGVKDNRVYRPIPMGLTVFERIKDRFGPEITTVFIAGKNNNLAARGPHRVCMNCYTRFDGSRAKTLWWDEGVGTPTFDGKPPRLEAREGEPYFNAVKKLDIYKIGLNEEQNVIPVVLKTLEDLRSKKFFAFFHFEEPDEQGHVFGEDSPEYSSAIERVDGALGEIVAKLKSEGLYEKTVILLTTDHGQDKGKKGHLHAPDTFLASNLRSLAAEGERRDVAPTILDLFGFDLSRVQPALNGTSLLGRK